MPMGIRATVKTLEELEFDATAKPAEEHKPVTKTRDKIGSCTKEQEKEFELFL
jgi:hypothetical protein